MQGHNKPVVIKEDNALPIKAWVGTKLKYISPDHVRGVPDIEETKPWNPVRCN